MTNKKRNPWTIGKIGEKKTKEYLIKEGYYFDKTDIASAGVDIICFKEDEPLIKLIECKATNNMNKNYLQIINDKQKYYYLSLLNKLRNSGFNAFFEIHLWRQKEKNSIWQHQIIVCERMFNSKEKNVLTRKINNIGLDNIKHIQENKKGLKITTKNNKKININI